MTAPALFEARAVTKRYIVSRQPVVALGGVDIDIAAGEYLAITGPSGSGKSTLMHILGLLDLPSEGRCSFEGCPTSAMSDRQRSRVRGSRIGFVFQGFHLLPHLDLARNVSMPLLYAGAAPEEAHARALETLGRVGLAHRVSHRPAELSGGELQRAAVARAIVASPVALLADEPTGNLDTRTGTEVVAMLEKLHDAGATLVMVTHDAALARRARRQVRMKDGRLAT